MRVIWTHIAKNGGHFIKHIAKTEYGDSYYLVTATTPLDELRKRLELPRLFIAVNHHESRPEILRELINARDVHRILLTRNPIDRFCSYVRHSTFLKGPYKALHGARLFNQELRIGVPLSPDDLLLACLERVRSELSFPGPLPTSQMPSLSYFALSQLWEAFFKMNLNISGNTYKVDTNPVQHLKQIRQSALDNGQRLDEYILWFISKHYSVVGDISEINRFLSALVEKNIFKRIYTETEFSGINRYSGKSDTTISPHLAAQYYGLLQEEFMLPFAASFELRKQLY